MGRLLVLVVCAMCTVQPVAAADDSPIAFLGVWPATGTDGRAELPALLDVALERAFAVAATSLLARADTETALGDSRATNILRCKEKRACLAAVITPLRRTAAKRVVFASYSAAGDKLAIKLALVTVADGTVENTTRFELTASDAKKSSRWRPHVAALMKTDVESVTGTVAIRSNIAGYLCTVDGEPCDAEPDGRLVLATGSRTIALSQDGYQTASRTVDVAAGSETSLAIELVPATGSMPATVRPEQQLPVAASAGYLGPTMRAYAHIEWAALIDPINRGDDPDVISLPGVVSPRDWNVGLNPFMHFGFIWLDEKRNGWQAKAIVHVGMFTFRSFRFAHAIARFDNDAKGFGFGAGRHYHPTVNPVEPGTLVSYYGYGSLSQSFNGVVVKQAFGPLTLQTGVGRPESVLLGEQPPLQGSVGSLFVESSVTYENKKLTGTLYGKPTPLRLIVSGGVGYNRFGPGEQPVDPTAATPEVESLRVWIGGVQALVPVGKLMLVMSGYVGEGAGVWGAAIFQTHHIDPATGRHSLLKSAGGFGQLGYQVGPHLELVAVGGMDKVLTGFDTGVSATGLDIRSNVWLAGIVNVPLTKTFRIGVQGHQIRTDLRGLGTASHLGAVVSFLMRFGR